jgi:hypothetical protein
MERAWKHLERLPDTPQSRSDAWVKTSQSRDGPEGCLSDRQRVPNRTNVT